MFYSHSSVRSYVRRGTHLPGVDCTPFVQEAVKHGGRVFHFGAHMMTHANFSRYALLFRRYFGDPNRVVDITLTNGETCRTTAFNIVQARLIHIDAAYNSPNPNAHIVLHVDTDHLSDARLVCVPALRKDVYCIVDESVQGAVDVMGYCRNQNALVRELPLFRTRPQCAGLYCRRGQLQSIGFGQIYLNYDHFRLPHQHPHAPFGNLPGDGVTQGDHITKFSNSTPATICHECMHSWELNHKLLGPVGDTSLSPQAFAPQVWHMNDAQLANLFRTKIDRTKPQKMYGDLMCQLAAKSTECNKTLDNAESYMQFLWEDYMMGKCGHVFNDGFARSFQLGGHVVIE